jgi:hypothetical protein
LDILSPFDLPGGNQERLDLAVGLKELSVVDHKIALYRQRLQGLNGHYCVLFPGNILNERLAGESLDTIDDHRIGTADAVCATFAKGQRAVDISLNEHEDVENSVGWLNSDTEILEL